MLDPAESVYFVDGVTDFGGAVLPFHGLAAVLDGGLLLVLTQSVPSGGGPFPTATESRVYYGRR